MKWIEDDGGRAAAGFKGTAGDCVARAVAIASGRPYAEVYAACAEIEGTYTRRGKRQARSARNGVHVRRPAFKEYMRGLGFEWTATMLIGSGCKVHLTDGELPDGRLVVSVSRHWTAVIDGVIRDTHDPQREDVWVEYLRTPRPLRPGEQLIRSGLVENGVEIPGVKSVRRRCVYGFWKLIAG